MRITKAEVEEAVGKYIRGASYRRGGRKKRCSGKENNQERMLLIKNKIGFFFWQLTKTQFLTFLRVKLLKIFEISINFWKKCIVGPLLKQIVFRLAVWRYSARRTYRSVLRWLAYVGWHYNVGKIRVGLHNHIGLCWAYVGPTLLSLYVDSLSDRRRSLLQTSLA